LIRARQSQARRPIVSIARVVTVLHAKVRRAVPLTLGTSDFGF
jgi:hypothetical protein